MCRILVIVLVLISSLSSTLYAQNRGVKTISTEVADAALYLQEKVAPENRPYIRFFTTYAVPEELQEDTLLQLSFICHSLMGVASDETGNSGAYYPVAKFVWVDKEKRTYKIERLGAVTPTLHAIDLRYYNWTPQAWENVSKLDGYTVAPVIPDELYGYIRLLAGNAVVRADWFIDAATNTTKQADLGIKNTIYRELLYASNKVPTNVQEFQKIWGPANEEEAIAKGNNFLTLTVNSNIVARHNRVLSGFRSDYGWSFRTYDVLSQTGKRDYFTNFFESKGKPPKIFDAGELIAANSVQMQVYDLINDKEQIINDANAGVARHTGDVLGDARVRVANSCVDCHAAGPIPSENAIKEFVKSKGQLNTYEYADKLRIERAYLSDKFEDFVLDSQSQFARALLKVNGLTPEENVKSYLKVITWYNKPLDISQVVLETGLSEKEIEEKAGGKDLLMHQRRYVPPRLSLLLVNKNPIPREVWEVSRDGIPSAFQATVLMIRGLTKTTTSYNTVTEKIVEKQVEKSVFINIIEGRENGAILFKKGTSQWFAPQIGTKYKYLGEEKNSQGKIWYKFEVDGNIGYVLPEICKLEQ